MDDWEAEELAHLTSEIVWFMKAHLLPNSGTDVCSHVERTLSLLQPVFETISLRGTVSISSPLLPALSRCIGAVRTIRDILDDTGDVSGLILNSPHLWAKDFEDRLSAVLKELSDSANVLSLVVNDGSSLESRSVISQAEGEKRIYDILSEDVMGVSSQILPSIKRPTADHRTLTVEEIAMANDNRSKTANSSRVVCPRARIDATSKKPRSLKFRCCCDDASHESQLDYKVFRGKSLFREEIGLDSSRRWSILLLSSNKPVIVRLLDIPTLYISHIQSLAYDIGIAYLTDQNKSVRKPDTDIETGRFECFQTDWGFPSTKVCTVMCESAGVNRSLDKPSRVVLKHYSKTRNLTTGGALASLVRSFPERYYHIILEKYAAATQAKRVLVTTQTQINHEENPLGRLFVTLENVFLVGGDKASEEKVTCNIHFGFDERREAECFVHYLKVAQMSLFESFVRGPFYDERFIYFRVLDVSTIDRTPAQMEFSIYERDLGDSKHAYRATLSQYGTTRRICFKFKSKVSDVKRLDLLQSRIWVYDHDANGKPYTSETDWETLTGQRILKPIEGATFVKGGHERTSNDWLDELDKLLRVMKPDRNDRYEKVKIAVIDSGLNDTVKRRYMAQNNIVYKDFTHETHNDSWHGTCCAKIICDIYEESVLFIARIFEKDHASDEEGPIRMSKAIHWAISNGVDIISISAGFRDYSKELDEAVTKAKAAGILVIAAAANWSNTGSVAFPARHNLTTMCIYSTNMGNQSSNFNPEPRSDTSNFAVLGEGFQHPDQKRNEQMSGTSMATAAAVGLAANIIDFSRQEDNKSYICRSQDVGKLPGMLSIFSSISRPAGSLRYIAPLDLLPANHGWNQERGRQRVREILSLAMERAN